MAVMASPRRGGAGDDGNAVEGHDDGCESSEAPWYDWMPSWQTAFDVMKAADERKAAADADEEDSDGSDSDGWNPTAQGAHGSDGEGDEDESSDDDWAPQVQGAADVKSSEQEAIQTLLKPPVYEQTPTSFGSKKEADAAGRMLSEMERPITAAEAKALIPKDKHVEPEDVKVPSRVPMDEKEGVELVRHGASVNLHGAHGRAPLHKAAECAFTGLVKEICDAGGEVDIRDRFGETPLLLASHSRPQPQSGDGSALEVQPVKPKPQIMDEDRCRTVRELLLHGADVHAVNPRGRGVLHLAASENDHLLVQTFIEGMADINAQDLAGFTALMWAAGRNGTESVKMLLDYEADMNLKALRGQTALTFALTNGNDAVADILTRHQALLDEEGHARIKESGETGPDAATGGGTADTGLNLALLRPSWACRRERPSVVEPYEGRVYPQARPDRNSNVYS